MYSVGLLNRAMQSRGSVVWSNGRSTIYFRAV